MRLQDYGKSLIFRNKQNLPATNLSKSDVFLRKIHERHLANQSKNAAVEKEQKPNFLIQGVNLDRNQKPTSNKWTNHRKNVSMFDNFSTTTQSLQSTSLSPV